MCQQKSRHVAKNKFDDEADSTPFMRPATSQVIIRLLQAHDYAVEAGRDLWEFAVSVGEFSRDGVTESDLRWLICQGYIQHAKEVSGGSSHKREFIPRTNLRISSRTAFVITEAGLSHCEEFSGRRREFDVSHRLDGPSQAATIAPNSAPSLNGYQASSTNGVMPKWDRDRRELRVSGELVKVFKLPSPMQETILMAFEEEGWPPRIDDPLPKHPDLIPKRRLHDTIKSLNRNQKNGAIRFMGDGTGEGIRWEIPLANDEISSENSALASI